ncbi:MAG: ABC transporter substrate-binding protein [Bacteroidota bacterium]
MISVPNHHRLLNGNNLFWIAFVLLFFQSCDFFTKAQDAPSVNRQERNNDELEDIQSTLVYDPVKNEWVEVSSQTPTEQLDTVRWRILTEAQFAPILSQDLPPIPINPIGAGGGASTDQFGSQIKNSYQISLMMPFLSSRFDPISTDFGKVPSWSIHYYSGVKLALEQLQLENISLKLKVLDSEGSQSTVQQLLDNDPIVKASDLIIGPYRRDNIKLVADFAKNNQITMISPYSASSNLTNENPNFIQVSPSLKSHCEAIMKFVRSRFSPSKISIIHQDNDQKRNATGYFQEANKIYSGSTLAPDLSTFVIPDDRLPTSGDIDFEALLGGKDSVAIIIPAWTGRDENFVYTLMTQIDLNKDQYQYVEVYGLPQWEDYSTIDLDYFEKLNVTISSNAFIDKGDEEIKEFRRDYYDRFGSLATLEAYLGYDIMLFAGRMLNKYGNKFQYHIEKEQPQYLHTRFEFERSVSTPTISAENLPIQLFENKYVNMLQFRNYRFQKLN